MGVDVHDTTPFHSKLGTSRYKNISIAVIVGIHMHLHSRMPIFRGKFIYYDNWNWSAAYTWVIGTGCKNWRCEIFFWGVWVMSPNERNREGPRQIKNLEASSKAWHCCNYEHNLCMWPLQIGVANRIPCMLNPWYLFPWKFARGQSEKTLSLKNCRYMVYKIRTSC